MKLDGEEAALEAPEAIERVLAKDVARRILLG